MPPEILAGACPAWDLRERRPGRSPEFQAILREIGFTRWAEREGVTDSTTPSTKAGLRPLVLDMVFIFLGVSAAFLLENYRDRQRTRRV